MSFLFGIFGWITSEHSKQETSPEAAEGWQIQLQALSQSHFHCWLSIFTWLADLSLHRATPPPSLRLFVEFLSKYRW